jgi:2-dehydro-3-deoxygluconokinase
VTTVVIGECMLELTRDADRWRLGYGGDTFNTAVYLSRLGVPTAYLTALGADIFSHDMRAEWQADGLDTSLVLTDGSRLPGLYAVRNDADGERHFYYWRERSAARQLFTLPGIEAAVARARSAQQLYLSGITLSLFSHAERTQLNEIAAAVRAAQGQVIFDPNYRPHGWIGVDEARAAIRALAPYVSVAMPTFTDEVALFGDASPGHTVARWREWGAEEVIVKLGAEGCLVADSSGTASVPAVKVTTVVDTTGAGDAFNAGFLAARGAGQDPIAAAHVANRVAAIVIQHQGAIVPRERTVALRACMSECSRHEGPGIRQN